MGRYADGWTKGQVGGALVVSRDPTRMRLTLRAIFEQVAVIQCAGKRYEVALMPGVDVERELVLPWKVNVVTVTAGRTFVPRKHGINNDPRELGIKFCINMQDSLARKNHAASVQGRSVWGLLPAELAGPPGAVYVGRYADGWTKGATGGAFIVRNGSTRARIALATASAQRAVIVCNGQKHEIALQPEKSTVKEFDLPGPVSVFSVTSGKAVFPADRGIVRDTRDFGVNFSIEIVGDAKSSGSAL